MKRCPICSRSYPPQERFCSVHGLPLVEELVGEAKELGELTGLVLDGRYRLAGIVGKGGMGIVYEAEHIRIGRRCAVKLLLSELHSDPKMRMRLFREVQATSRVRHQNVVEILDFGDDEVAGSYLVMEFLEGHSLAQIIRAQAPLPLPFVLKIGLQLTAGLSLTHSHGLIHRDLKPSNVKLLPGDRVKILDFGLVKPFDPDTAKDFVTITTGGIAFGTPWYMSPEQATFQQLDPRTDIYSLGIILYEMLTGRPPFIGDNPLELIDSHRSKPVPLPTRINPQVVMPPAMEMLLLKALEKTPDKRFPSMADCHDALRRIAKQQGIEDSTREASPVRRPIELPATPEAPEWTLPVPLPSMPLPKLENLLQERQASIIEGIVSSLRAIIPRYRDIEPAAIAEGIRTSLQAVVHIFNEDMLSELPAAIRQLADQRSAQLFTPSEIIMAMWIEIEAIRPLIDEAGGGPEGHPLGFDQQLEQRILAFIYLLVDYYFSRYHQQLVELNQSLSVQNAELFDLREKLTDQFQQASRQLLDVEKLKARVVEYISSGLLLVEHGRVKLFNKAMERLTGITASQAVGRPYTEVISFIEGVPTEEFMDQLRTHGEVGLRKLWVRLPSGAQKAVYVRGQVLSSREGGDPIETLIVVDDVTERENIIESFSRYLSREVVDQVLRRKSPTPTGEKRRVVLLSINLRDFRTRLKELEASAVVELLTDFVRTVGDAMFHHGGVIDSMTGDTILVYFDNLRDTCAPALTAAIELCGRLEGVNQQRATKKQPPLRVGIGVHVGEVLVVHVGGKRRMVHTVVGEAAVVARALQEVASAGEILVSAPVAESVGGGLTVENGPVVAVEGQTAPVSAFRLVFVPQPLTEPSVA